MNKYQMPEVLTKKNSTLPLANNVGLELSLNSARRCNGYYVVTILPRFPAPLRINDFRPTTARSEGWMKYMEQTELDGDIGSFSTW